MLWLTVTQRAHGAKMSTDSYSFRHSTATGMLGNAKVTPRVHAVRRDPPDGSTQYGEIRLVR